MEGAASGAGIDEYLDLAVRAFAVRASAHEQGSQAASYGSRAARVPRHLLVFDTETTVDPSQRLLFGSWRYFRTDLVTDGPKLICVQEGIFYPDDLADWYAEGAAAIDAYAVRRPAAAVDSDAPDVDQRLVCAPLSEFLERILFRAAYRVRAGVACFNAPFDFSRLAWQVGEARTRGRDRRDAFAGGFSFGLWSYERGGERVEGRYRPRVAIKTIDSKRALKSFRAPELIDEPDLAGAGDSSGKSPFRGHFLDLRTLAFALTDRGHTLESACDAFAVSHRDALGEAGCERRGIPREQWGEPYRKQDTEHGRITPEYIDYCRDDVAATAALCEATLREFLRHPIDLQATRAFSPATLGRSYLRRLGVSPPAKRQRFDHQVTGWAMSAYYGGRAECRIRRTSVPVVYCDFASMYPTVCALMGAWRLLVAHRIEARDATADAQRLLDELELDSAFRPQLWPRLLGIAQIAPAGDVLPVRARYSAGPSFQIGVNPLHSDEPMWFTLADLAASKLLTGKPPQIKRAIRFDPVGTATGLSAVELLGSVAVDPASNDFFRAVVEERRRAEARGEEWRAKGLKVLANATSYGIYAQMTRHELGKDHRERVEVYGQPEEPWTWSVTAPEDPGEYCFPPLAASITGAARLMLALLECLVTRAGGTYAFCDTDSMAIVSSREGGAVSCPGGRSKTAEGEAGIDALSWAQVEEIRSRFAALNPYKDDAVPGSILELEDENYGDESHERRQLWCYAISAKRYVLYNRSAREVELRSFSELDRLSDGADDEEAESTLRKPSEHGLGYLLNPIDPESDDRDWIAETWRYLLARSEDPPAAAPSWLDRPAVARHSISTPATLGLFKELNAGKPYAEQVKPYNFLNIAFVDPTERPADEERVVLVAPYEPNPDRWLQQTWVNRYTGRTYKVTTEPSCGRVVPGGVTVRTYRDVIEEFASHPETKSLGPDGRPCGRMTIGLLSRRHVHERTISHIGKESNRLEDAHAGLIEDVDEVVNTYDGYFDRVFEPLVLPVLRELGVRETARRTGHSVAAVSRVLTTKRAPARPHRRQLPRYIDVATAYARELVDDRGIAAGNDPVAILRKYVSSCSR